MTGLFTIEPIAQGRPHLPVPALARWQPLRLGVVELFHYDSEEFWFRDGHLLLRGNNGTGKSKLLSLTLPLLLDAQLKSSRIEPDGDAGKKMAWNLLMGSHDRRLGYSWIEFGRVDETGTAQYLTLGIGLSAVAARPQVESWFFILEDRVQGTRIGSDLWLLRQGVVLTKERLREALQGRGHVFDSAGSYRRAVDERLFHLGPERYGALMDTLIQLRQPQLSKKPDEASLSEALTESLPPLPDDLLRDVAEAFGQIEEDRRQLEQFQALERAVGQFNRRYRTYAGTQSRREARPVRQAQTDFDKASRLSNQAQAHLQAAGAAEQESREAHDEADLALNSSRARYETLRSDPTMQDANRLARAVEEAAERSRAMDQAGHALDEAGVRLERARIETGRYAARVREAEAELAGSRWSLQADAVGLGMADRIALNPIVSLDTGALQRLPSAAFEAAQAALRAAVATRREKIAILRRQHSELVRAEVTHIQRLNDREERQLDFEDAAAQRKRTDAQAEQQGNALVEVWTGYLAGLQQIMVRTDEAIEDLLDWVTKLGGAEAAIQPAANPAGLALQAGQQRASLRLAERRHDLDGQRSLLDEERRILEEERRGLEAGADAAPPVPYTRDPACRAGRDGAPLWQLIDFRAAVVTAEQAGLEAALEASGLLDAWITPSGQLQIATGGEMMHDTRLLPRMAGSGSLADWPQPDTAANQVAAGQVSMGMIERVLSGIACGRDDASDREAWISPDGRFRLGALAGAWAKPAAVHIGFAARAAGRERRLREVEWRLDTLAEDLDRVDGEIRQHEAAVWQAADEWQRAPSDQALRNTLAAASAASLRYRTAQDRLVQAEALHREAEQAWQAMRQALARDAADLRLPGTINGLAEIETALAGFGDRLHGLVQAARDLRQATPEHERQLAREAEIRIDREQREQQLAYARTEAARAEARLEALRSAIGAQVEALQHQLDRARQEVADGERIFRTAGNRLRHAGESRAVAVEQAAGAEQALRDRTEARLQAVARLQKFAATGLLSAALPEAGLPPLDSLWTIDPALTLARRIEQALSDMPDDEETWSRIQRQVAQDLTELTRALTSLGQQGQAETSDFGLVVTIVYQNRSRRPDQLAVQLGDEIAQRVEVLTEREREILENHLQSEIASAVQRLLQKAERQVDAINRELYRRPTSTGVRYRLKWTALPEGGAGAPVGLEAARKRLLNTDADLWSSEDKRVVGTMLQQRITAERERADAAGDGNLLDHLARALDYRRWHVFRVERWQDGQWRKLSGPASSGERALGLTVPLFAAVASFYSQGDYGNAPRLMLLDEAFAGIDDSARAHCMALIREFDLDFVITSEREWGCYAELPGVAICELQKREGIDAVYVSRWTWDGRAKRPESDPDRRIAPV